ncbi:MAG: hypothetical protein R3B09_28205 [Nannocystaceae bacterium]
MAVTRSRASGFVLSGLLTGACSGEGIPGGEATSHDPGTTTSATSESTTTGPTTSATSVDTSGATPGTTAETTTTSTSTSATGLTTIDTEVGTTEAATTEAATTTETSSTETDATTGGVGGCQGPSDRDEAWSRSAGAPDRSLRAQHLAVDHTGAVVLSDRFRGALDLGGGALDGGSSDSYRFLVKYDGHCEHAWSLALGGEQADLVEFALAVDPAGDVVIAGSFYGAIALGETTLEATFGVDVIVDVIELTTDLFVAKFSPEGQLLWARRFGDDAYQRAHDVATTSSGSIIVVGGVRGSFDLGGAPVVAGDRYDGLLAEFDADGELAWHKTFGAATDVGVFEVDVSAGGLISIGGGAGSGVDFGGGPLAVDGDTYEYYAQFEPTGEHRWSRRFLAGHDPRGLSADDAGAVHVTGEYKLSPEDPTDVFVARLDAAGNLAWTRQGGAQEVARGLDVAVAPGGDAVIVGTFRGSLDLGDGPLVAPSGNVDMFVARYGADGALHSSLQVTGSESARVEPYAIRFGPGGERVVAGSFRGAVDLGPGPMEAIGKSDLFVHRAAP